MNRWIIVALWTPTQAIRPARRRKRDKELAHAIAQASGALAVATSETKRHPFCARVIQADAVKRRYCGEFLVTHEEPTEWGHEDEPRVHTPGA